MPTYNEAGNIVALMESSIHELKTAGLEKIEIIVVDDNSPDRTWELAEKVQSDDASIRVIRRMANHGLTASIKEGIDLAKNEVIVWLDCDFSHPPEKIPQILYMIDQGFDIAVNSRYIIGGGEERVGKGGPLQRLLSTTLNWFIRFFLYPAFSDYTSGFVAVRKEIIQTIGLRGDYGEYFVDFIFRAIKGRYQVCELPYWAPPRRSGESKTGKNLLDYLRRGCKYIGTVLKLRLQSQYIIPRSKMLDPNQSQAVVRNPAEA